MEFWKTILNLTNAFEKEYKEKLVETKLFDFVKDMMHSALLTEMSVQRNYGYVRAARMKLQLESVSGLVGTLNDGNKMSKRLLVYHLNDEGLYTSNQEKLSIVIEAAGSFLKNETMPTPSRTYIFYSSGRTFLGELQAVDLSFTVQPLSGKLLYSSTNE